MAIRERSWHEERDLQYELKMEQAFMSHRELEMGGVLVVERDWSWKYRFRNHDSLPHNGLEEYRFESFHQSVKTIWMLTAVQSFASLNH